MDAADNQKPSKPNAVFSDEQAMGPHGFDDRLIMESQRDLDRAEGDNQNTHQHPGNWQIIQDAGNVREISEQQRQPDNQHAYRNDNASPFQDITETAHGKAKEFSFFEAYALYPRQADRNEIHLDVDSQEIFENERGRIDCGRDPQEPGG